MKDLLAKQNEHLEIIANLMKTDRLMQLAQTYGIREIDKEDSHSSDKLDEIASSIRLATDSQKDERRERKDRYKQEDETGKKHLDELKKIQTTLVEKNNLRNIADKSKDTPIL